MALKKVWIEAFGSTYNCSNESGNTWKVSAVTPGKSSYNQPDHYYPVVVKAEDEAGNITTVDVNNETLGALLKLIVKETTAPTITITSPTEGQKTASKRPQVKFTVTDNDSGVNEATVKLTIGDNTYTVADFEKEATEGGFIYTYTPTEDLPDAEYTATVAASDNDGNAATPKSVHFEVFAAAPTLSVESPTADLITNQKSVQYRATTNAASIKVTVNGSVQEVTLSDGVATGNLTLVEGENTIVSVATSETGVETTISRKVTVDTKAPEITDIDVSENPATTGATVVFTITVTD